MLENSRSLCPLTIFMPSETVSDGMNGYFEGIKSARRSPVTASQGSAETPPRPQEKNRLSRLFRHFQQPTNRHACFSLAPYGGIFLFFQSHIACHISTHDKTATYQ